MEWNSKCGCEGLEWNVELRVGCVESGVEIKVECGESRVGYGEWRGNWMECGGEECGA